MLETVATIAASSAWMEKQSSHTLTRRLEKRQNFIHDKNKNLVSECLLHVKYSEKVQTLSLVIMPRFSF